MKGNSPLLMLDAARGQSRRLKLLLFLFLGVATAFAQSTGTGSGSTSGTGTTGTSGSGSSTSSGSTGSSSGSSASAGDFSQVQSWMAVQGQVKNGALIVEFSRKDMGNTTLQGSRVSSELVADGMVAFYPLPDFTVQSTSGTGGTSSSGSSTSGSSTSGSSSGTTGTSGSTGTTGSTGSTTSGTGTSTSGSASVYDPFNVLYPTASLNTAGGPWFLMTVEMPLLESEVNPFLQALNRSDISVAAVHNHYLMDNPRMVFVHLEGVVNQARIQIFKSAVATTGMGAITDETENSVSRLNQSQIGSILGGEASGSADVVEVSIPRDEQFSSCLPALDQLLYNRESQQTSTWTDASGQYGSSSTGTTGSTTSSSGSSSGSASSTTSGSDSSTFSPAAGNGSSADSLALSGCNATVGSSFAGANSSSGSTGSTGTSGTSSSTSSTGTSSMGPVQIPNQMLAVSEIRIQAVGNGQGFLVGELALLPSEVDLSRRSLIAQGFQVSAIHNHSASISPELLFLHISKHGNAVQMSQTVRRVMDQNRIAAGQISASGTNGTSGSGSGTTGTGTTGSTGTTGTGSTGSGSSGSSSL